MAEFCRECYVRICGGREDDPLVMSSKPDLCEGCGRVLPVVVRVGRPTLLERLQQLFGEARRRQ